MQANNHEALSERLRPPDEDRCLRHVVNGFFTVYGASRLPFSPAPSRAFWLTLNVESSPAGIAATKPGEDLEDTVKKRRKNDSDPTNHCTLICRSGKRSSLRQIQLVSARLVSGRASHTRRSHGAREATKTWYKEIPRCIIEQFAPSLIAGNLLH